MSVDELTPREREVLELTRRGLSNEAIAEQLGISHNAVRYHLKELHSKLETGSDRKRLARWRHALLPALWLPSGLTAAKATLGAAVGLFAIVGATVAFTWSDADAIPVRLVDGKYPNGCPDHYSSGQHTTLRGFMDEYGGALGADEVLISMNPHLIGVTFSVGTSVRVPYRPNGRCSEVTGKTPPAGSSTRTPSTRGTPQPDR